MPRDLLPGIVRWVEMLVGFFRKRHEIVPDGDWGRVGGEGNELVTVDGLMSCSFRYKIVSQEYQPLLERAASELTGCRADAAWTGFSYSALGKHYIPEDTFIDVLSDGAQKFRSYLPSDERRVTDYLAFSRGCLVAACGMYDPLLDDGSLGRLHDLRSVTFVQPALQLRPEHLQALTESKTLGDTAALQEYHASRGAIAARFFDTARVLLQLGVSVAVVVAYDDPLLEFSDATQQLLLGLQADGAELLQLPDKFNHASNPMLEHMSMLNDDLVWDVVLRQICPPEASGPASVAQ